MKISKFGYLVICIIILLFCSLTLSDSGWLLAAKSDDSYIYLPIISNPVRLENMVLIPAGEFQMGCDENNAFENYCVGIRDLLHRVYLDAYYIDKYEVTNEKYAAFLNKRNSNDCGNANCMYSDFYINRITYQDGQYIVESGYNDHPVSAITWYGADAYCEAVGGRLPTEAEWEKAARGDVDTRKYPWGNEELDCTRANFDISGTECGINNTTPVGSYPTGVSMYGVFDLMGNVEEWVNDFYLDDYYSSSPYANPPGPDYSDPGYLPQKGRRGGNWWNCSSEVHARDVWSAHSSNEHMGLRCAVPLGR